MYEEEEMYEGYDEEEEGEEEYYEEEEDVTYLQGNDGRMYELRLATPERYAGEILTSLSYFFDILIRYSYRV